jgi:hypothetical protein
MENKTSVDFLIKELSEILGPLKTEPMQDLLMIDAINKAKEMHKEEIVDSYIMGSYDMAAKEFRPEQYYEEVYEGASDNEDDLSDWDVTLNDGLTDED